jgi:hypothetical protein
MCIHMQNILLCIQTYIHILYIEPKVPGIMLHSGIKKRSRVLVHGSDLGINLVMATCWQSLEVVQGTHDERQGVYKR